MKRHIYRVKFTRGQYGSMWYAEPRPGFDKLAFPVLLGADTCSNAVMAAYKQIETAERRQLAYVERARKWFDGYSGL